MIWIALFYWIVCGFAFYAVPTKKQFSSTQDKLFEFILCMIVGGFAVPAKALMKAIT